MVKPRRKSSSSDKFPRFFKIYVPGQSSKRLRIPRAFVKHGLLPSKFVLKTPAARTWRVEVNKVDDNLYFQEGWQEFVQDNSLEFGDFLVFCHGSTSMFHVTIYGTDGCRKEVLIPTRKSQRLEPRNCELEDDDERVTNRTPCPRGILATKAASKFSSAYPFFKVVMRPAYVNKGFMNVPSRFFSSHVKKDRGDATLQLSGKSWPVKLTTHNVNRFSKGWLTFSKDNSLQPDDVCFFELVEINAFVLRVTIFRCPD